MGSRVGGHPLSSTSPLGASHTTPVGTAGTQEIFDDDDDIEGSHMVAVWVNLCTSLSSLLMLVD